MKLREQVLIYWIGEFGWELMTHQAWGRKLAETYDVHVICRPSSAYLYEDYATSISFFTPEGGYADCFTYRNMSNVNELQQKIQSIGIQRVLHPQNRFMHITPTSVVANNKFLTDQKFIKFTSDSYDKQYNIIIHARARSLAADVRNWSKDEWDKVGDSFSKFFSVASIGLPDESYHVSGTVDERGLRLKDTVSLLNKSLIVVGQSSGAMHLASLCGAHHFVWSGDAKNRERYEKVWNPLDTVCYYYMYDEWKPQSGYEISNAVFSILQ